MKFIFTILFLCISITVCAQISICSWNLQNLGKSKDSTEIPFIAETIKSFDIIAVQEVVASYRGTQAVARLADELNRLGSKWDYVVSDPTTGAAGSERYAFIWKTSKVKKGKSWMEKTYSELIVREPFYCDFIVKGKIFTLVNFHAIPKGKQPETEIKYLKFLPDLNPDKNLIFCGDFNLPQSHTVFNPLRKMGYKPALIKQKTTLKQVCANGECLASEYDNFYFDNRKITKHKAGVVKFYQSFVDMKKPV